MTISTSCSRGSATSGHRFYQKITDIYAKCSIDYDASAESTNRFYATVQNKLHWAIHGHTAAEIIHHRADRAHPTMGLSTWKQAPSGPIRRGDVSVAKNYLTAEELEELNRVVTMYLDYAEDQAPSAPNAHERLGPQHPEPCRHRHPRARGRARGA